MDKHLLLRKGWIIVRQTPGVVYFFLHLILIPARPNSPVPNRMMVEGSGTGCFWGLMIS